MCAFEVNLSIFILSIPSDCQSTGRVRSAQTWKGAGERGQEEAKRPQASHPERAGGEEETQDSGGELFV